MEQEKGFAARSIALIWDTVTWLTFVFWIGPHLWKDRQSSAFWRACGSAITVFTSVFAVVAIVFLLGGWYSDSIRVRYGVSATMTGLQTLMMVVVSSLLGALVIALVAVEILGIPLAVAVYLRHQSNSDQASRQGL